MPSWDAFLEFLYQLPSTLRPGRQSIRVVRDNLQALVEQDVMPHLTDQDHARLFPLGYSPAESDLKLAAGVGLERGYISVADYEAAIRRDKAAGPFGFLQTLSGKTFGETVAPRIAEYWLRGEGDKFDKRPPSDLYDIRWNEAGKGKTIRIELKASTEDSPNFQQIRHPKMTNPNAAAYEYDVLLCLHVSNAGLEWWAFPSRQVEGFIETGEFGPQHGGQKVESGTYWVRMDANNRNRFRTFQTTSEDVRSLVLDSV